MRVLLFWGFMLYATCLVLDFGAKCYFLAHGKPNDTGCAYFFDVLTFIPSFLFLPVVCFGKIEKIGHLAFFLIIFIELALLAAEVAMVAASARAMCRKRGESIPPWNASIACGLGLKGTLIAIIAILAGFVWLCGKIVFQWLPLLIDFIQSL